MVRETRHLWVGNLPENVREEKIIEHFKRYGRVESVKILPKRGSEGGVAAFVDFVDIKSAQKAHNSVNKMGDRDLRTDYNEPGTIPSAARGLDDTVSIASRSREVSGFRGGGGGPSYGPPPSLHAREGRYERRLDGASDNRERAYEHSAYGHHERGTGAFDRTRHYDQDYYRDPRERNLQHGLYYTSRSRSPNRFEAHDPRYEPRAREQFTLSSVVHRDIYRDDITREVRGRRPDRNYQHSRSRSPHSSQSRTQSPQRLASQASRPTRSPSGSGSRSRSSSSDSISSSSSTSSDSSDSSSSSSDESPARSVPSTAVPAPPSQPPPSLETDEPRKSFGIKVQNLPVRSTDTSLKDGLFHEFKKYGKVTSVQIHGASEERYGLVFFRQQEDQEKALNASKGKLFFGMQIEVTAWVGPETESENEFRPLDERIDEFHPKATRTLFIGNLEKTTTYHDLRNIFQRFGEIVDIDIKKVNGVPQYAFLQYCDIASVCKAIKKMDGEYLGNNRLKLGFGKSMPTNSVWLDGLSANITDQYLTRHFCRYGPVVKVVFDRLKGMALVLYNEIEYAQAAVKETKGRKIGGNKIKVDFANRESQLAFYRSMESSGQDIRDFYEMLAERRGEETRRGSYEYTADRTYYDTVRAPGTFPEDPRREYPARSREFYAEWDPYQGDYYDPRYYEDPREYRDYRDPYEQDIREYSYRQRERERERERFESDRDRDHERRPVERSQSPNHSRRPQSPGASPSQSERLQSDSERRIYSRSSDHSGSCSSLSPPRFDKLEKARAERYVKNDKVDKERPFDQERSDKEKRIGRKEKPEKTEKDKSDKLKRKAKINSPSSQSSETDQENEREPSPEKLKGCSKQPVKDKVDKEGTSSKNRLELMPCVVLTRVKEKEGKVVDSPALDKLRGKLDSDTVKSPPVEQKVQIPRVEQPKADQGKPEAIRSKVTKDKVLASHVEIVDKEGKLKAKKHIKGEQIMEGTNAVDLDKLEARKRRFADVSLKPERQKLEVKRSSQDEEDARLILKKQHDMTNFFKESTTLREMESERKPLRKDLLKRDLRKIKPERCMTNTSPKEGQESANILMGMGLRTSLDLQSRLGEPVDELLEPQEIPVRKLIKLHHRQMQLMDDQGTEKEVTKEGGRKNYCGLPEELHDHKFGQEKPLSTDLEEKIGIDIDHTQSYRKQMEQSRRLKQQMEIEIAKSEKFGSPRKEIDEYEKRSLVHEVGKPPQDVTDDSPPSKRKKTDHYEFEINTKRERNYRSSRQSEDSEKIACSPSLRLFLCHDDDTLDSPKILPVKEIKESPKIDEKGLSCSNMTGREDFLKFNPYDSSKREQMADKVKMSILGSEEESNKWESQAKQEPGRDVSFPSSVVKKASIRKRSLRDLEPGEVPSDSEEENDSKSHSPKVSSLLESSRFSLLLRDGDEKPRERDERLSSSSERNKFYSFALDKTITPDTKALLERAKSLSSSREENWSFLDWDSSFASFRNNKDKEKVDSAPRPIPSWYMKKKKIRTDSEGKLDDKKEDHKEEEQERQELFASRFLHSSIFEQDSKRLQHLERKDDDPDFMSGRLCGRQMSSDGVNSVSDLVQEPVVLFHSRFIELTRMQQKEKEKDQKKEAEKQEDKHKTSDSTPDAKEPEVPSAAPCLVTVPLPTPITASSLLPAPAPESTLLVFENTINEKASNVITTREEKPFEHVSEESKPAPEPVTSVAVDLPVLLKSAPFVEEKKEIISVPLPLEDSMPTEHPLYLDTKPLTPGTSFSEVDVSVDVESEITESSIKFSKSVQKSEEPSEPKEEKSLTVTNSDPSANLKLEGITEITSHVSDNDMESEPPVIVKDKKSYKSKRSKTPVQTSAGKITEKPATRKSERIDREKRNRSTSPRGESQKLLELKIETEKVSRSAGKPPISTVEPEITEPSLPVGRTRRRNVRSVYASTGDSDGPSLVKEPVEQPRTTRKRVEKESQETVVTVPNPPRRGRPPKSRRKTVEEILPVKMEKAKQEVEEVENKETVDIPKSVEGWRSPRSQKMMHNHPSSLSSQTGKKGKNESKIQDVLVESNEDATQKSFQEGNDSSKVKSLKEESISEQKHDKKETETDKSIPEVSAVEIVEKKVPEKVVVKAKIGRPRSAKTTLEQELRLKNVEIRLNVDEVKGALKPSEEDTESVLESPGKIKNLPNEDNVSPPFIKTKPDMSFPDTSEIDITHEPKLSPEAAQLARQIELEQAVQNIAKLTETTTLPAYKDQATDVSEVRQEEEGDKPAHQANETELAAAIGSIISDISTDAESFPAPPTYPTEADSDVPADPVVVPSQQEEMEPETGQAVSNILESEASCTESSVTAPASTAIPEATGVKERYASFSESSNSAQEAEPLQEADAPRKEKGRPKITRQRRKRNTNKKAETVDTNAFGPGSIRARSPIKKEVKSISEVLKDEKNNENILPALSKQTISKQSMNIVTETISLEPATESKVSAEGAAPVDLPPISVPVEDVSQTSFSLQSGIENSPITPTNSSSIAVPTVSSASAAKLPTSISAGLVHHHSSTGIISEWMSRHEESHARSTPPPAMPPDTKASDIDTNSSTLRKILMEPKYVSSVGITATNVTTAIVEPVSAPHVEEPSHPPVEAIKPVSEEKTAVPASNAVVPPAAEAPVFIEKEKITTVIAHKATSVISRMAHSFDFDDNPRITLLKQPPQSAPPTIPSPKYKQRTSTNDNRSCMKSAMSVIEDRPVETGSSPGLRVNTSEGVVVLSHSGQKTEGPQRISAKISQIPPASAVDIEFQQSVSKSQIKPEPITSSQPTSKGLQTSSGYVTTHPSLVLGSQSYSTSPVISVKQDRSSEKSESCHVSGINSVSQSSTVKVLSQPVNNPPVLVHNQMMHSQSVSSNSKKTVDSAALKVESKVLQSTNLSPGLSPHHSSISGKIHSEVNHVRSGPNTPTERALPHLGVVKQEQHSPRTSGHSQSPFPRACHPSVTSSAALTSNTVMLGPGISVPQYISSIHPEQTVIMPPHSVTQPVSLSHLSQGDVRMNTPPLPGIPYGIRPEALHSPRGSLQPQIDIRPQRSSTPQPAPMRDMVMPPLSSQHPPDDDMHYHHSVCRGSAPVQSDVLVMQPDYHLPSTGMRLDPYSVPRDVRMMMHSHLAAVGDHHPETRQSRTPEGSVKTPPASKTPQPGKDIAKQPEVKMAHSPHSESRLLNVPPNSQLSGISLTQPVVVPHGVPLIHPPGSSFHDYRPVYSDIRSYHTAAQLAHTPFPGASSIGLSSRSITPSQSLSEGEHPSQPVRSKTPQVSQDSKGPQSAGSEQSHHTSGSRHPGQMEPHLQHLQRSQVDTAQTTYPSPVSISMKQELPSPHQTQTVQKQSLFISNPLEPGAAPGLSLPRSEPQSVLKQEQPSHSVSQRPVDMVQLLTKYPIVWQGLLALKNDTAAVQLHFVSGNNVLAHRSLPAPEGGPPLRIAQRMRLEASQLEGVARRMMVESDYCLLLALPCGRDQEDVVNQTESLKAAFISYLQAKQAAGIINVPNPGSNQPAYVLQIFPPCEFSESHLSRLAPDLLASISNISPHLMIVIASV